MGLWWTEDHDGVVELYPCGGGLCGRVAGIVNFQPDGSAPKDVHGRSRCHLALITSGTADSAGVWDSHITNPDDGKTYTIRVRVDPDGAAAHARLHRHPALRPDGVLDPLHRALDARMPYT